MEFEFLKTDEEIRAWMDAEMIRLGAWFREFTLTWHRNERIHWLELWSESKGDLSRGGVPGGKSIRIGEVPTDEDWIAVPVLQHEGRKLYYRLHKHYLVKRDLAKQ